MLYRLIRALDEGLAHARAAGQTVVSISMPRDKFDQLTAAITALGWTSELGDLVAAYIGLPISALDASDAIALIAISGWRLKLSV